MIKKSTILTIFITSKIYAMLPFGRHVAVEVQKHQSNTYWQDPVLANGGDKEEWEDDRYFFKGDNGTFPSLEQGRPLERGYCRVPHERPEKVRPQGYPDTVVRPTERPSRPPTYPDCPPAMNTSVQTVPSILAQLSANPPTYTNSQLPRIKQLALPTFTQPFSVTFSQSTVDPCAGMYERMQQQHAMKQLESWYAERKLDLNQLHILFNNMVNAYETMSDTFEMLTAQIKNEQNLTQQITDFCNRPCAGYLNEELNNLCAQVVTLRQNLHHKLNWFINLPHKNAPFGHYMQKIELPAVKKALGGQNPAGLSLFTPEMSEHWTAIYTIAAANAKQALSHFDTMKENNTLTLDGIHTYVSSIRPYITKEQLVPLYESLYS